MRYVLALLIASEGWAQLQTYPIGLPQELASTSSPTFAGLSVNGGSGITRARFTPGSSQSSVPMIASASGQNLTLGVGDTEYIQISGSTGYVSTPSRIQAPLLDFATGGSNGVANIVFTSAGSKYGSIQTEATAGGGAWSLGYKSAISNALGSKVITWTGDDKIGFFAVTPVARAAALTAADVTAINTGDATSDAVIGNMRTRIGEIATALQNLGLIN